MQRAGRTIPAYDLLDEVTETYGLDRREAHDSIHAFLADLGPSALVAETLQRPELADSNPGDVDVDVWVDITDEAAEHIREAFAAVYEPVG